jgi:predicted RNA-binding protein
MKSNDNKSYQGKVVKIDSEHYQALSDLLQGRRQRSKALEGLIDVLSAAVKENKYILFDLLMDPQQLEIRYHKKKR